MCASYLVMLATLEILIDRKIEILLYAALFRNRAYLDPVPVCARADLSDSSPDIKTHFSVMEEELWMHPFCVSSFS